MITIGVALSGFFQIVLYCVWGTIAQSSVKLMLSLANHQFHVFTLFFWFCASTERQILRCSILTGMVLFAVETSARLSDAAASWTTTACDLHRWRHRPQYGDLCFGKNQTQ